MEYYIIDRFLLSRCQKKRYERSMIFLGSGSPSKIGLLQSFEVIWMHGIYWRDLQMNIDHIYGNMIYLMSLIWI